MGSAMVIGAGVGGLEPGVQRGAGSGMPWQPLTVRGSG